MITGPFTTVKYESGCWSDDAHYSEQVQSNRQAYRMVVLLVLLILSGLTGEPASAQVTPGHTENFITVWKANGSGQITIPGSGTGYNYDIYWANTTDDSENGSADGVVTTSYTITGLTEGEDYRVEINGTFPRIFHPGTALLEVKQWGVIAWTSMDNAFYGASNLEVTADDTPDLGNVTNTQQMFYGASSMTGAEANWNWDTDNVTTMAAMFVGADLFNQNIGSWDTGNVENMNSMFWLASSFNQDIGGWDTGNVTDMSFMFTSAGSFNQNIGSWNIVNVTLMSNMLDNSGLSVSNYDATLTGWAGQTVQSDVMLSANGLKYCQAAAERQSLIDDNGWTIIGDSEAARCNGFITVWKANGSGQITIPGSGTGYNYDIYWENTTDDTDTGSEEGVTSTNYTITGLTADENYRVEINGTFPRISQPGTALLEVNQWGDIAWTSMENAFLGATNLEVTAADIPDLENVTNMNQMFYGASSMTGAEANWNWDTGNVTTMTAMFVEAALFNQNIGGWDTGNVEHMSVMFWNAASFNQDIGGWDTSNVTDMSFMFAAAGSFNQDIGGWNTGNVTTMHLMFVGAGSFNQDIGGWDISNVATMNNMLDSSGLSIASYDATLTGWAGQTVQSDVTLGADGLKYCQAAAEHQALIDAPNNWTITGDSVATSCDLTLNLTLSGGEGWRFLTSPVIGETFDGFLDPIWTQGIPGSDFPGTSSPNVYRFNQEASQWEPISEMNEEIGTGTAFIVWVYEDDASETLTSEGDWIPLDGSFTYTGLFFNPDQDSDDEHFLIANPHPVSLDFCEFTKTNISESVWFWNPSANGGQGDYIDMNCAADDVHIAPFQGFWVQAMADNPELGIPEDAYLVGEAEGFFKEKPALSHKDIAEGNGLDLLSLSIQSEDGIFTNRVRVLFGDEGSGELSRYDTPKLSAEGLALRWLSFHALDTAGKEYAFLNLPADVGDRITIPLDIRTTEAGPYILSWTLPSGLSSEALAQVGYYLRDTHTGKVSELRGGQTYRFEVEVSQAARAADISPSPPFTVSPSLNLLSEFHIPRFELILSRQSLEENQNLPTQITLNQNYPNPFNPSTVIAYELPMAEDIRLDLYDMTGRHVATLVNKQVNAGRHSVSLDASSMASGIYIYRLQAGSTVMSRKLTVIK